jgi:nucleoside-diphosphate-sugar epimerase
MLDKRGRVTLTGATGYLGFAFLRGLIKEGFEVQVICRDSSDTSKLRQLSNDIIIVKCEANYQNLADALHLIRPQCVVHMAAQSPNGILLGSQVSELIASHVEFPTALLEAMTQCGAQNFINTESFWQYGRTLDEYAANSIYAATKTAFKEILAYYALRHEIRAISLVLGDTYGPDDPRRKLLNTLKQSLTTGECVNTTPGHQLVAMTHVDDVVEAYLCALRHLLAGSNTGLSTYTVGLRSAKPLKEIIELAENITGRKFPINWGTRPYRETDLGPIPQGEPLPGWRPKISLSEGLSEFFAER